MKKIPSSVLGCHECPFRQFYSNAESYVKRREVICSLTGIYIQDAITDKRIHETCKLLDKI